MIVFISSTYEVAKNISKTMNQNYGTEFCSIEADFGNDKLTVNDIGIKSAYSHHKINDEYFQPCLTFQITNDSNFPYSENFIISHVDADTIFGIGWLCGMFDRVSTRTYNTLKDISLMISTMDNFGYHSISKISLEKYKKEFSVILSYVSHAKKSISKVKFQKYYNCSSIIIKCLHNIIKCLTHSDILNKRFNLINKGISEKENIEKMDISTDIVHIYKKRINDFKDASHSFIIVWDISLSIYGRNHKDVSKYFPEGLNEFLNTIIPESGGHFCAAGTKRKTRISNSEFQLIIDKFKERIGVENA